MRSPRTDRQNTRFAIPDRRISSQQTRHSQFSDSHRNVRCTTTTNETASPPSTTLNCRVDENRRGIAQPARLRRDARSMCNRKCNRCSENINHRRNINHGLWRVLMASFALSRSSQVDRAIAADECQIRWTVSNHARCRASTTTVCRKKNRAIT